MITFAYLKLAVSSIGMALLLAVDSPNVQIDQRALLICMLAAFGGGASTQLRTADKRKPTKKVIAGEMIISSASGIGVLWACGGVVNYLALFGSVAVGMGGSVAFLAMAKQLFPNWFKEVPNENP